MFNVPYRLRKQSKFEVPIGPNLANAPTLKFNLDGTKIRLRMPRGNSVNFIPSKTSPSKINLSQASFEYDITDKPGWNYFSLLFRSWDFCGDWFLGRLARVTANLVVIKPSFLKLGTSFFHPRVFEAGLADYITYSYGDKVDHTEKTQDWLAPVDWSLIPEIDPGAILFKAVRTLANHPSSMQCFFARPIDETMILLMACNITRFPVYINSTSTPEKNINDWVDDEPMRAFVEQLLRGIQVELSTEALIRQRKALEQSPDAVLAAEFLPIKFI